MTAVPRQRQLNAFQRATENFAKSKFGGWMYIKVFPRIDPFLLRATGGRFSVSVGQPILLLTHTGAKSGQRRQTPLLYTADGERVVLIASKAGNPKHPAWYHNLKANPRVQVLARGRSGEYVAREADGEERDRLWDLANDLYAGYDTYQGRAGARTIPVMVLERA